MNLHEAALLTARDSIGLEEIKGNQGFKDPVFDRYMRMVGFENGWAWCSIFAKLCWLKEPYERKAFLMPTIDDCFAANAVRTYENFAKDKSGEFEVGRNPLPGSTVVWEKRVNGAKDTIGVWVKGHAGIVEEVHNDYFIAIEGNTNSSGGREGFEVARKKRKYNYHDINGLCLLGFISEKKEKRTYPQDGTL